MTDEAADDGIPLSLWQASTEPYRVLPFRVLAVRLMSETGTHPTAVRAGIGAIGLENKYLHQWFAMESVINET